jgi:hypothetical protein
VGSLCGMTQKTAVQVLLDPDEHAKLAAEADKAGQTVADYAAAKLAGRRTTKAKADS